jgi:hypothetical protein
LIPILLVLLLAVVAARIVFGHQTSRYESIAADVTQALQKDDVAKVKSFQDPATADRVTDERVGRGADALARLGSLVRVRQTGVDPDGRTREFDVTFQKGSVHETISFGAGDKIVGFHYDAPMATK